MRSPTRSTTSSGHITSMIGSLSHTTRTKTQLSRGIEPSRPGPTPSLIGLVHLPIAGCSTSNMCVTSLTRSPQHPLVAKFLFKPYMVSPLISASSSCTPSITQFSMLPMINTSHLTVKRGLVSGLVLLNIVVTLSPTWFLML